MSSWIRRACVLGALVDIVHPKAVDLEVSGPERIVWDSLEA